MFLLTQVDQVDQVDEIVLLTEVYQVDQDRFNSSRSSRWSE